MTLIPTLRWSGPADATNTDSYEIYNDQSVAGQFQLITNVSATAPYASPTTTLAQALGKDDTTVQLGSGASFAANDYVMIGQEVIRLGTKSGNVFSECVRGVGYGLAQEHDVGAKVYRLHENYVHNGIQWNSGRILVRYRIVRVRSNGDRSIAAEALVFNPPLPPNTRYITIFMAIVDSAGNPVPNLNVTVQIGDKDNSTAVGELILKTPLTRQTGEDGGCYFFIAKDSIRRGGDAFVVYVARGTEGELMRNVNDVPDLENAVNFLIVATVPAP